MPDYALYGLVARSNRTLGGLEAAPVGAQVDIEITLGAPRHDTDRWGRAAPHYVPTAVAGTPASVEVRRDRARGYLIRFADGTEFALNHDATAIEASWDVASTPEDTATYLLGPVLGFALRLRGVLALHASAVVIDGHAVALVGPSGAGKSTTAAAFAAAGIPVLSDDVVAVRMVDGVPTAFPSYRLLRLWQESEQIVFGTRDQLPPLTPTWDKLGLALGAQHPFHPAPAPLRDVFLLASRSTEARAPYVEDMPASEAFMQLVANSYANYLLDDAMRREEMLALGAAIRSMHVRRLVPHSDPGRVHDLVRCVQAAVGPVV